MKLSTYQKTLPALPEQLINEQYLVPAIVQDWGRVIGTQADALASDMTPAQVLDQVAVHYKHTAQGVALLLRMHGVSELSEDAAASAKHRWASKIDPWVSVDARVVALHQAYRQEAAVIPAAEKLWAGLEARCTAITGRTFKEVLGG